MITTPGIYTIDAADYHARDLCPEPALSSSIARALLMHSPRHAWWSSPLNPAYALVEEDRFDRGTAAHACLLEGRFDCLAVYPGARTWQTKAAQEFRAAARAAGKMPLLEHQYHEVQAMVAVARPQLAAHRPPVPLTNGKPEQTLVWQEDGIWLRARLDWLHDDFKTVDDYKSTDGSANPDSWIRGPLVNSLYYVQAGFYLRGVRALTGVEATFRFVVQETRAPYQLSVIGLAPSFVAAAEQRVSRAIRIWRDCLDSGTWPGYPTETCYAELPAWESARIAEELYRDDGRPIADQLMGEDADREKKESTR